MGNISRQLLPVVKNHAKWDDGVAIERRELRAEAFVCVGAVKLPQKRSYKSAEEN